ncbi:MAG: hypothetical protein A2Y38_03495 [Spirochaetes bacterium GWB1_59_5]|nr:MAG: hypothetical protein A2Y38_03495 [Spirochaetes bacterium GWB1_59_5]
MTARSTTAPKSPSAAAIAGAVYASTDSTNSTPKSLTTPSAPAAARTSPQGTEPPRSLAAAGAFLAAITKNGVEASAWMARSTIEAVSMIPLYEGSIIKLAIAASTRIPARLKVRTRQPL